MFFNFKMIHTVFIPSLTLTLALSLISLSSNAHEVWLERDNEGPTRIYLGEPGEPDKGEKLNNLVNTLVFTNDRQQPATLKQNIDHWAATVNSRGDVRLFTDHVWKPWEMKNTSLQGAILEAREGRNETHAKLNFELVPFTPGGDVFTAIFQGKPVAHKELMLLTPSKKEISLISDKAGKVELSLTEKGRYILSGVHTIQTDAMHSGKQVTSLMYITSLSFRAQ
jgi:uncharacterized GH25 family protein